MENTSNQVSGVKKGYFKPFEIFFWKIMLFRGENEKKFFINTFRPEMSQNSFQTWFPTIFMIWAHQNGIFGFFVRFRAFLLIFSGTDKLENLPGIVSLNMQFLTKIHLFGYNTMFGSHKIKRDIL